jgi:hypothetical protein
MRRNLSRTGIEAQIEWITEAKTVPKKISRSSVASIQGVAKLPEPYHAASRSEFVIRRCSDRRLVKETSSSPFQMRLPSNLLCEYAKPIGKELLLICFCDLSSSIQIRTDDGYISLTDAENTVKNALICIVLAAIVSPARARPCTRKFPS